MVLAVELGAFNPNFFVFDYRSIATVDVARTLRLRGFSDQASESRKRPSIKRRTRITQY
jgi:hypothetical protein